MNFLTLMMDEKTCFVKPAKKLGSLMPWPNYVILKVVRSLRCSNYTTFCLGNQESYSRFALHTRATGKQERKRKLYEWKRKCVVQQWQHDYKYWWRDTDATQPDPARASDTSMSAGSRLWTDLTQQSSFVGDLEQKSCSCSTVLVIAGEKLERSHVFPALITLSVVLYKTSKTGYCGKLSKATKCIVPFNSKPSATVHQVSLDKLSDRDMNI